MNNNTISVVFADSSHAHYAPRICDLIYESALQRGTGIAKRSPEYIDEPSSWPDDDSRMPSYSVSPRRCRL